MKAVLANLGFLLQISGFFVIPPIAYAAYTGDTASMIALTLTSLAFFVLGFPLNALEERKALNIRESAALIALFFVFVPLINTIPYVYLGVFEGSVADQIMNSYFETVSSSTTTGLTLTGGISRLPASLVLARGFTDWVGGLGVIFIVLTFFYSSSALFPLGKVLGVENPPGRSNESYKRLFMSLLAVYTAFTALFTVALWLAGTSPFLALHTTLTVFSTSGPMLVNVFTLPAAAIAVVAAEMFFAGLSFAIYLNLFSRNWGKIITKELLLYAVILVVFTFSLWATSTLPLWKSLFHTLDFSSSTGVNSFDFSSVGDKGLLVVSAIMLVGAMSFSMGGGIRILRFYVLWELLTNLPKMILTGQLPDIKIDGHYVKARDAVQHLLMIFVFLIPTAIAAIALTGWGYSLTTGLVEASSAITTTGDSPADLSPALPIIPKVLLIVLMIAGRIEIVPLFIIFSSVREHTREALDQGEDGEDDEGDQ